MDDAEGGADRGAEEGADTAVPDDDGEETEETTVKSAAPSNDEVNGLIGRDGGALLDTLGTLVNGGTGGDGGQGEGTRGDGGGAEAPGEGGVSGAAERHPFLRLRRDEGRVRIAAC